MLLVRTFLAQSLIDGLGLFAGQQIPIGTQVWRFDPRIDLILEPDCTTQFPSALKGYFDKYAYLDPKMKKYVVCGDDARFVNHSGDPNLCGIYIVDQEYGNYGIDVASREIFEGEELTCDYTSFDADFSKKPIPGSARVA